MTVFDGRSAGSAPWERARAIADAVLYEGYLLYPYRSTSAKNQARWQWGVLGGEEDDSLASQFLVRSTDSCVVNESGPMGHSAGSAPADSATTHGSLRLVVRFLQLQHRQAQRAVPGGFEDVDALADWVTWDEAVECEVGFGPYEVSGLDVDVPFEIPGGRDVEDVDGGRLVRTRQPLRGRLSLRSDGARVSLTVRNLDEARPFVGTHVIAEGSFVSLLEPDPGYEDLAASCTQHRCFPVLAGKPGERDLLLISPIILYDHPEIAEQSEGALFDATEIDEILTLRVMTMTDEEKAQARATDPRAAAIIDQCDAMSPDAMARLHGTLRDPHLSDGLDWWDPFVDSAVDPETDAVVVDGVRIAKGSRVRLRPSRRADAHDMFFAGRTARVTAVHEDVDGQRHVAVVVEDDPAADLHDWYGRYLYFAPDEVEPIGAQP